MKTTTYPWVPTKHRLKLNPFNGTKELDLFSFSKQDNIDQFLNSLNATLLSEVDYQFHRDHHLAMKEDRRPILEGIDPDQLEEAGWAPVFTTQTPKEIKKALKPLLDFRRNQAGGLYMDDLVYEGGSAVSFMTAKGSGPGPVDPKKLPYYLMLVGSPQEFSFDFQADLGVPHGVGRLYFENPDNYRTYANQIIKAETAQINATAKPELAFFGPNHDSDESTLATSTRLGEELPCDLSDRFPDLAQITKYLGNNATRKCLANLICGNKKPNFLFTAGHGMVCPRDEPYQKEFQGALICSEWPGPQVDYVSRDHFFAAQDLEVILPGEPQTLGSIAFLLACYSLGTSVLDFQDNPSEYTASESFVARLPVAMLRKGWSAVIAHVDSAYLRSFIWGENHSHLQTYASTLSSLLKGARIGWAMEPFGLRYAELQVHFHTAKKSAEAFQNDVDLAYLWIALNDARYFQVLGDPAVRFNAMVS